MLNGLRGVKTPSSKKIKDMIIPLLSTVKKKESNNYIFYAHFSLYINFKESLEIKTGGVRVTKRGMEFVYNPDFIMSLPDKALRFFWLHELFHLLNRHNQRLMMHNHRNETANVAMDIAVNEMITQNINSGFADYKESPLEDGIFLKNVEKELNKKYRGPLMYEAIYKWLIENAKEGSTYNPSSGQWGDGEHPKQMDVHLEDEVTDVNATQVVANVLHGLQARGYISADLSKRLGEFTRTKKDYMRLFASAVSGINGNNKEKSYNRPNRRFPSIRGLKGNISGGNEVLVILDTSGSMVNEFQKAISQIFKQGYLIQLIQCDTKVKSHTKIENLSQFKNLEIKGLGGTVLQPAIEYINENPRLRKHNLIILTDGYTDSLDLTGIKKTLILTVGVECPIKAGNVKQIVIEK